MSMTKKDFIALADAFRFASHQIDRTGLDRGAYEYTLSAVVRFCSATNPRFNEQRFRDYIAGRCGPNGGSVKPSTR